MSSSPSVPAETVVAGNVYPKYTTRNPLAHFLVANFIASLRRLSRRTGARVIHEVGCGEGFLSTLLAADGFSVRGSDLSPEAVRQAIQRAAEHNLDIPFRVASLYDLEPARDSAELIVCCEVLEHLPDSVRALRILKELATPHLIVSVPREPLWRVMNLVRGKYWRDFGNTPGHLQHWSTAKFLSLLRQQVEVVEVRTPLPWTMALCRTG
jgi:2-polyprenyl-3-methyl-5-hydroxy-6-metoxy-1,4-benzoquinol methylase